MSDQLSGKKGSTYPVVDEEFSPEDKAAFLGSTRIHAVGFKAGSNVYTDGNLTLNDLKTDQVQANWDEVDDTKPSYIQNKPTIPSTDGLATEEELSSVSGQIVSQIPSLDGYATEQYVNNATNDMATQTWVGQQGYLTSVPAGYATESYVNSEVSGKQDKIDDLEGIRSSAELGATAVQPSDITEEELDEFPIRDIETVIIGGKTYTVVTIGTQKWLGENLDLELDSQYMGKTDVTDAAPRANYYNNGSASEYGLESDKKYGLLYNWPAVQYLETNKSTLFPGWHVATVSDYTTLKNFVDSTIDPSITDDYNRRWAIGKKLKSKSQWTNENGTDDYGFAVVPAGSSTGYNALDFTGSGSHADLWTATQHDTTQYGDAYRCTFRYEIYTLTEHDRKRYAMAVRLVKDSE